MPSSLILQGGAAQTRTLVDDIVQDDHGLAQGDVVRWDTISTRYVRALADTPSNSEVVGIVSEVANSSNFKITYSGYVSIPALSSLSDPVLFLSSTVPGGLVGSPPSAVGSVVKPVLTRNTTTGGYIFTNYLGTQIGGSSTISVDEIQPVGTIMPLAVRDIPDTWLPCEGEAYPIADYPELYAKVLRDVGDRAPRYGHVANISVPAALYGAAGVGQIVILRNAGAVDTANYDLIGRITAKTAANNTLTVQILPKYDATTRTFAFPNSVAVVGANIRVYTSLDLSAQVGSGGAVSAVVLTHFNVPDLRGRFALGSNATAVAENAQEGDSAYNSALSVYNLGSLGGEERHTLTTSEMPSHNHGAGTLATSSAGSHTHGYLKPTTGTDTMSGGDTHYINAANDTTTSAGDHTHTINGSVASAGSNTPHNNMPPYVAVRYIIKAKPYTRAAIIEGIDLPYNDLLVRNLRTRNVGGTNEDLLFHVNVSGDSGSGTERMRLGNFLTIKPTASGTGLAGTGVYGGIHFQQSGGNDHSVGMTTTATHHSGTQGGILIQGSGIYGTKIHFLTTDNYDQGMKNRMTLDQQGRLGVNTAIPTVLLDVNGLAAFNTVGVGTRTPANGVALDIVGQARSSIALADYATANAKTLTTKEYVDSFALNMMSATPSLLPFSYTCVGANWTFDENGNYITAGVGKAMFHMPSAGVVLNNISVISGHGYTRNPTTYSTAVLPVGTWDICCFMFSNLGPGNDTSSDDDKFTFYRCYSARLVSTTENRANVVGWLVTRGFGTLLADNSGNIRNYRGHQAGTGFAVRVS